MIKCLYFNCDQEARPNQSCCGSNHGIALKQNLKILPVLFDADESRRIGYRELIDIETVEYYAKLQT